MSDEANATRDGAQADTQPTRPARAASKRGALWGGRLRRRTARIPTKVLLLGGTEEARQIAEFLHERGIDALTSLAGRTAATYPGDVRMGGFGGEDGLVEAVSAGRFSVIVDATHPFAGVISPAAQRAARRARIGYLRIERPPWRRALGDRWVSVPSLDAAASAVASGANVFLTVGAGGVAPFLGRTDLTLTVRSIEPPDLGGRQDVTVLTARGPFDLEGERALFAKHRFDVLVAKNAGGTATAAKLVAARERRTLVFMVERPGGQPRPAARTVDGLMRRLRRYL